MTMLTWLHISDLHFRVSQAYNANVVLKALLRDIAERVQADGLRPEFIAVTGDIAFSGQPDEYNLARDFIDKLLSVTGTPRERLFVVPGNHDANRNLVTLGVKAMGAALADRDSANTLLATREDRQRVMARFRGYAEFVNGYLPHLSFDDEQYFYVRALEADGRRVALLGLNSAWLCASDKDKAEGLLIGERQARAALEQTEGAHVKIALLHHPFDWLREFDQNDSAAMLTDGCDFILHGHLHRSAATQLTSPDSAAMILAGGACYETRDYPNMVNWVRLDLATGAGAVFLRRYSPERGGFWAKDTLTYRNVQDGVYTFALRGRAPAKAQPSVPSTPGQPPALTGEHITSVGDHNINVTGGVQGGITVQYGGQPSAQPAAPQDEYDLGAVRELLSAAFSDEEIVTLAFDRFRQVYEDISGEMGKTKKIRLLVDWCNGQLVLDSLLAEVKRRNPNQYARYASRLKRQ
jgi:UDP-2,3-diacylglucosamine pyrophosphatase LpxH